VLHHCGNVPNIRGSIPIDANEGSPWFEQVDRRLDLRRCVRAGVDENDDAYSGRARLLRRKSVHDRAPEIGILKQMRRWIFRIGEAEGQLADKCERAAVGYGYRAAQIQQFLGKLLLGIGRRKAGVAIIEPVESLKQVFGLVLIDFRDQEQSSIQRKGVVRRDNCERSSPSSHTTMCLFCDGTHSYREGRSSKVIIWPARSALSSPTPIRSLPQASVGSWLEDGMSLKMEMRWRVMFFRADSDWYIA